MVATPNPSEPAPGVPVQETATPKNPVPDGIVLEVIVAGDHPQSDLIPDEHWQAWFSQWATQVNLPPSPLGAYELSLTLTDDGEIANLNSAYRHIERPTDVLSFAALEDDTPLAPELLESEPLYLGDIIISLDTAQRQAEAAGHSLQWETVWLASHGFLHLLGWDHPDEDQLEAMLAKQGDLLRVIGWAVANAPDYSHGLEV